LSNLEDVPIPKPLSILIPVLTLKILSQRFPPSRSHVDPISLIPTPLWHLAWNPIPSDDPHFRWNKLARWPLAVSMVIAILFLNPSHRSELFFFTQEN